MLKKYLILTLFLTSAPTIQGASGIYALLNKIGDVTDFFISKGDLSPENEALFNEVAKKLGIAYRNIKAKDSGLILRLLGGYQNALAVQQTNRVYFNNTELNTMSTEEKKFIMGHELTHHANNDVLKMIFMKLFTLVISDQTTNYLTENRIATRDSILPHYLCSKAETQYNILNRFANTFNLNIWGLLNACVMQKIERNADRGAILNAGVHPKDGKTMFKKIYYPNTQDWPLYAKIQHYCFTRPLLFLASLPILTACATSCFI